MLATVNEYVAAARTLLQDEVNAPYRYSDASLVLALNMSLYEAKRLRPDLFLGKTLPAFSLVPDNTTVDVDPMYRQAHLYYIVGQAQLRDDEAVQDARAAAFLNLFNSKLLSSQA